ncbi:MAG: TIM barrel protein [Promethearchaeota archaeon]
MTRNTGAIVGVAAFPFSTYTSDATIDKITASLRASDLLAAELLCLNNVLGKPRGGVPGYPSQERATKIGEKLQEFHVSIHGPYVISLTTTEKSRLRNSRAHMTICLRLGERVGATHVTFHPGSRRSGRGVKQRVVTRLKEIVARCEEEEISVMPAPEVAGKIVGFGSFEEMCEVASEVGCLFCWDVAHDFARGGDVTTEKGLLRRLELIEKAIDLSRWRLPVHISGIWAGRRGEIRHAPLDEGSGTPWKLFLSVLKEQRFLDKVSMICESKSDERDDFDWRVEEALKLKTFIKSQKIEKDYEPARPLLTRFFSKTKDGESG